MKNILVFLSILLVVFSCNNSTSKIDNSDNNETLKSEILNNDSLITGDNEVKDAKIETYCNARFGFCIDYPSNILIGEGESENGDGQVFKSKNGNVTLSVYRDYRDNPNSEASSVKDAFAEDIDNSYNPKRTVTYKHLGKNYYIVSGYNNGVIFYQKTISTKDGLASALIEYPENDKELYDQVVEEIFKSFKWHQHKWVEA